LTIRSLLLLLAVLLLHGCAGAPRNGVDAPPPDPAETRRLETLDLLLRYGWLTTLSAGERETEHHAAQLAFMRSPDDRARLWLALVTSLPGTPWHDDKRVLQLLEPLTAAPSADIAPLGELALLLQNLVSERQRMAREEQRKAEEAQQRMQLLLAERQRQLRDELRRSEELKRKFDALRGIERELRRREPGK
jgi:hypothetical protein